MRYTIWFPILGTLLRSEMRLSLQSRKAGLCHPLKGATNSTLFLRNRSVIIHRVQVTILFTRGSNCSRTLQNGSETLPIF
jgi:hypothetical protein